jgi:putative CocE/NonD family hydrolase
MGNRVLLERNVDVPMRDGTLLRADVFRPDDGDAHPVLVQRTPYDKTFHPFIWPALDPTKAAEAGYAVVIQDVRGRWASAGEFYPYVNEAQDGHDTIQWAAAQPWSSGDVGTYGISYMGQSQWLAASTRPPALRAIATVTSPNDAQLDLIHRGGALHLGVLSYWTTTIGLHELVRRRGGQPDFLPDFLGLVDDIDALDERVRQLPLVPFRPLQRAGGLVPLFDDDTRDEVPTERHRRMGSSHRHADITVPALQIAGWYDLCLQADLDHFTAMRATAASEPARRLTRIVVAPWAHAAYAGTVGELDFGLRASGILLDLREDLTGLHRRWFDARLRGLPTGIDDEPPVKIFVMGRNRWRYEDEWPPRRSRAERWHLRADGRLSRQVPEGAAEPQVFTLDPDNPVPTTGGSLLMSARYLRGPVEQSRVESRPDVLVFTSEPVTEDYEVTGRVTLVCHVSAETPDTDVVGKLCDVHPDGGSYNVVDGIRRLRFRDSLTDPTPATPGEVYRVAVDLWSTSHVFRPGHRLRVVVAASDFPRFDRCPGTGEGSATATRAVPQRNRLFTDAARASYVELPQVPN